MAVPATLLGAATRYQIRGNLKLRWVPLSSVPAGGVASSGALTSSALAATWNLSTTIDLTPAIAATTGWNREQGDTPAPDINTLDTPTVPGEITRAAASVTAYLSKIGTDIRQALIPGDLGFMLVADLGFATGKLVDIWPAEVKFTTKVREDVNRITVPFTTGTGVQEDVPLPASTAV